MVALEAAAAGVNPANALAILANTFAVMIYAMLAGAGINTQPVFQAVKGLHGSTLFTLSLPVRSRFRLLVIRAGLGWMEMAALIATFCLGSWFLFPLSGKAAPVELAEHAGTLIVWFSELYFFAVLLATFLNDSWRIAGSLLAFTVLWLLSEYAHLPSSIDIYRAMQEGSPLVSHAIPWIPMTVAMAMSAGLFLAALRIAQRREY